MINNKSCLLFFVMLIEKRAINKHFTNKKISGCGRDKFIKMIRDDMYAQFW